MQGFTHVYSKKKLLVAKNRDRGDLIDPLGLEM